MLETLEETGETQISLTDPDSHLLTKLNSHKMAYNVRTADDGDNAMAVMESPILERESVIPFILLNCF